MPFEAAGPMPFADAFRQSRSSKPFANWPLVTKVFAYQSPFQLKDTTIELNDSSETGGP